MPQLPPPLRPPRQTITGQVIHRLFAAATPGLPLLKLQAFPLQPQLLPSLRPYLQLDRRTSCARIRCRAAPNPHSSPISAPTPDFCRNFRHPCGRPHRVITGNVVHRLAATVDPALHCVPAYALATGVLTLPQLLALLQPSPPRPLDEVCTRPLSSRLPFSMAPLPSHWLRGCSFMPQFPPPLRLSPPRARRTSRCTRPPPRPPHPLRAPSPSPFPVSPLLPHSCCQLRGHPRRAHRITCTRIRCRTAPSPQSGSTPANAPAGSISAAALATPAAVLGKRSPDEWSTDAPASRLSRPGPARPGPALAQDPGVSTLAAAAPSTQSSPPRDHRTSCARICRCRGSQSLFRPHPLPDSRLQPQMPPPVRPCRRVITGRIFHGRVATMDHVAAPLAPWLPVLPLLQQLPPFMWPSLPRDHRTSRARICCRGCPYSPFWSHRRPGLQLLCFYRSCRRHCCGVPTGCSPDKWPTHLVPPCPPLSIPALHQHRLPSNCALACIAAIHSAFPTAWSTDELSTHPLPPRLPHPIPAALHPRVQAFPLLPHLPPPPRPSPPHDHQTSCRPTR